MRCFAAVLLVLSAVVPTQAQEVRPLSLRELTYRADTVVLAVPLEPTAAGRFKVTQVLRGHGVKNGATIELTATDRQLYSLAKFIKSEEDTANEHNAMPAVTDALLFLAAPTEQGKPGSLVSSGLFFATPDGDVLAPRQLANPGPFTMTLQNGRVWQYVVRDTKEAAKTIDEVLRLKAVSSSQRATGLLNWIERHRLEFGGGFYDDERNGWGSLETDVFGWCCTKARHEQCWIVSRLYAELNHGAVLPLKEPYFGTPAGREFLFQIALNERLLEGDRARALTLLAHPRTLAPAANSDDPDVIPCSETDLALFMQKMTLLLEGNSQVIRAGATGALRAIQSSHGTSVVVQRELKNALPALERVYKAEKPSSHRDLVIELIHTVGGAEHWKEFSGNKTSMVVLLRDFGNSKEQVYFWLQVLPGTEKFYERPTLVLERLGPNDKVLDTKTLPLPAANAPRWEEGWTPDELLLVQFPSADLSGAPANPRRPGGPRPAKGSDTPTGIWRVSVRGTVGKDKAAWMSEPKLFTARPPSNAESAYDIYSGKE